MSGEVAEHDYATYIIEQALESGDNQVVIAVGEFAGENFLEFKSANIDGSTEAPENTQPTDEQDEEPAETVPSYRSEAARGTSGYWSEADVHRLLRIYLKHLRAYPNLRGRPINFIWDKISRDFDRKNRFTRHQIKTKIQRLKNSAKALLVNGEEHATRWPFMKLVLEIIKMEGGGVKLPGRIKGTQSWQPHDIEELLTQYRRILQESPDLSRRQLFTQIAKNLGRPRFDIQIKFQSLKASWKRCVDGIMHNSWPYLHLMQAIMDEEKKKQQMEETKKLLGVDNAKSRGGEEGPRNAHNPRWGKEQTFLLLNTYKEKLEEIKASKTVVTKIQVYRSVAQQLRFSVQSIQVKLSSLKTHWNKHGKCSANKWHYYYLMRDVVKLENAIWLQGEEESDETEVDEEVQKAVKLTKDLPEPSWVKHYRQETQRRHEESMQMRVRILKALEKLVQSDTLPDSGDDFDSNF